MTITATRALAVLSTFGAPENDGDFFETTGSVHVQGALTPERLSEVVELVDHRADLGLVINISDEFDAPVEPDGLRAQEGQRVRIGVRKPNTETTFYLFTVPGLRAFLDEPQALGARRVLVADLAAGFETLACTFEPWIGPVPDEPSANPVADISPKRFVYDLVGRCPWSVGMLIEKNAPAVKGGPYLAWRTWATQRLRDVLVSEIRDLDTVVLKGERTIRASSAPPRDLSESDFLIANGAAHWIYAESTKDVEARHTFFINSLTREWQSAQNWFEGLLLCGGAALDAAGNYYRRYLSDATVETIKSLADLRKNLADDVAKVTQQTRDLINMLWRDFAIAVAALVARAAIGSQNPTLGRALLYSAAIFLTVSILMTLLTNRRFGGIVTSTWTEWRKRLYGYLTDDDYKSLAQEPLESASAAYRGTAWTIGILYALTVATILALSFYFPYQNAGSKATPKGSNTPSASKSKGNPAPSGVGRIRVRAPARKHADKSTTGSHH